MLTSQHAHSTLFHTNRCLIYSTIMSKGCANCTQFWTKREVATSVRSRLLPRLALYMTCQTYNLLHLFRVHAKILCAWAGIMPNTRKKQREYVDKKQKCRNIPLFLRRRLPPLTVPMAPSSSILRF